MKFSIIMPTYRRPHTLPRAIASVLAQTYRVWELIVVDNAGDVSGVPDDPRIRLVRHAEKPSASYARNQGLGHATGDVVCFLDDDDIAVPVALQVFADAFRTKPAAKIVCGSVLLADGHVTDALSTQAAAVRREYATATWDDRDYMQDQRYWHSLITANRWTEAGGDIVKVGRTVALLTTDPRGGLRAGAL